MKAREDELRELGGLLVEMYRRGAFREDLLAERSAQIVGIDARLAEIEELLSSHGNVVRCECGAPILRGSHFCPNCGRSLPGAGREPRCRVGRDRDRAGAEALMASEAAERRTAIAAADTTCPRCGASAGRGRPLLPRLRAQAAGGRRHGAGASPGLAAAIRLVPGRLGLALAADAARRGGRRRGGDRGHDRDRERRLSC